MKTVFFTLLLANIVAGAWLLLGGPVDVVREPGRMDLQLDPGRLHVLSEADLARKREQAQSAAASAAAAAAASGAAATPPGATAAETPALAQAGASNAVAAPPAAPPAAAMALPLASCIDIGNFTSESAARKLRSRLASAGLGERTATRTADKTTRLRITGVDAAGEAQIHLILRDFPKQEMSHCSEAPAAK